MNNQAGNPYAAPLGELWREETVQKSLFWHIRRVLLLPLILALLLFAWIFEEFLKRDMEVCFVLGLLGGVFASIGILRAPATGSLLMCLLLYEFCVAWCLIALSELRRQAR